MHALAGASGLYCLRHRLLRYRLIQPAQSGKVAQSSKSDKEAKCCQCQFAEYWRSPSGASKRSSQAACIVDGNCQELLIGSLTAAIVLRKKSAACIVRESFAL